MISFHREVGNAAPVLNLIYCSAISLSFVQKQREYLERAVEDADTNLREFLKLAPK